MLRVSSMTGRTGGHSAAIRGRHDFGKEHNIKSRQLWIHVLLRRQLNFATATVCRISMSQLENPGGVSAKYSVYLFATELNPIGTLRW